MSTISYYGWFPMILDLLLCDAISTLKEKWIKMVIANIGNLQKIKIVQR